VEKHDSQKDYKTGFGGKFGVQTDRVDKSAVGWEHIEKVEKHESQKGIEKIFTVLSCCQLISDSD
jgi:cortactin